MSSVYSVMMNKVLKISLFNKIFFIFLQVQKILYTLTKKCIAVDSKQQKQ